MGMTKKDIKEILKLSKEKLREGNLSEYYSSVFNDNISALISGIVKYREIKGLLCDWGDVISIMGEIFNKESKIKNDAIKEEILRLVPKNFSFNNFSLVRIMNNE